MSITASIQQGVAAARAAVLDLMIDVEHKTPTGRTASGWTYPETGITRKALVEDGQTEAPGAGTVAVSTAKLTFLEPIPITPNDTFTVPATEFLPAGIQDAEVLRHYAPLGGDKKPIIVEVWLGKGA